MDGIITTLNFATAPAARGDRLGASIAGALMAAVGASALFVGMGAAPVVPSALALMLGAIVVSQLLSAFLLYGQLLACRVPSLAPLATAYLTSGLLTIGYLLTFPQILAPSGLFGANEQTALILWCVWHAAFPLLVAVFAVASRSQANVLWSARKTRIVAPLSVVCSIVLTVLTLVAAIRLVPNPGAELIHNGVFSPVLLHGILPGIVFLDAACLLMLAATRLRTIAQVWLLIAILASLLDTMTGLSSFRYSVGWYIGKAFSVTSSLVLLTIFLFEITRLYQRLASTQLDLYRARDAALDGAKAKMEFLSTMSHEIRTPINAIMGMNELLATTKLDAEQREFADVVHSSAGILLSLVNQVLDFSKLESGGMRLDAVEFDPGGTVERTMEMVAGEAQAHGLTLVASVAASLPARVRGDETRLRQVLLNLLSNSLKFTQRGSVSICAELASSTPQHDVLCFTVADTGIGIPRHAQEKLFSPFTQGESFTNRRFGGMGLGLSIAARIVEAMGGTIAVESEVGAGSTFRFTVRVEKADAPTAADPSRPRLEGGVLMLSRTPALGDAVAGYVHDWGAACHVASDFADATASFGEDVRAIVVDLTTCSAAHAAALGTRLRNAFPAATNIVGLIGVAAPLALEAPTPFSALLHTPFRRANLLAALCERAIRVLVVDDNATNCKLAVRQLAKLGLVADAVSDGAAAVAAVAAHRYSLVLMDCQMPNVDGYEATRKIRALSAAAARCAIVAMTAGTFPDDRESCLSAGMDDYLTKPVTLQDMCSMLQAWVPAAFAESHLERT